MSETEHKTGKLKLVSLGLTLEETAKTILEQEGWECGKWYDDNKDALEDLGYRKYLIANNCIYKVVDVDDKNPDEDIFNATRCADGSIDFEVKYYNGGCSFNEALEESIKGI